MPEISISYIGSARHDVYPEASDFLSDAFINKSVIHFS
jgi:hypothetical protein